jgi:hypothetical protein
MAEAMKLNLASGAHPLEGFTNLDKENGWLFEDGLHEYADGSVEAITESHGLMYVELESWPFVFGEFARVLKFDGIIRITEDATDDPRSPRYGGFDGAVTLTSFLLVEEHLLAAGLEIWQPIPEKPTVFRDTSLMQSWHGGAPKCFFIEGIK